MAMVDRHLPTTSRMEAVGRLLHGQVEERFSSQGGSGDVSWPPVKLPPRAGNPALSTLESTFTDRGSAEGDGMGEAEVGSDYPHIKTHQFGATIVPRRAKALWVPISEKAKLMSRYGNAPYMRIEKGQFKGLRLLQSAAGELKQGIDFLFLKRAVIPARPMLPNSANERNKSIQYTLKVLAEP